MIARNRSLKSLTLAGLALATSACGQSSSWPFGSTTTPDKAGLTGRPALPEMVARYERLVRDLRTALARQLGTTGWATKQPTAPTALCQEFGTGPDTGIRTLPFTTYDRFVPGPEWEKTAAIIHRVAARYGFDRSARVVDRPDEHRLELFDHYGASLSFQDGPRLLSIGLITGCHLRNSAKPPQRR